MGNLHVITSLNCDAIIPKIDSNPCDYLLVIYVQLHSMDNLILFDGRGLIVRAISKEAHHENLP